MSDYHVGCGIAGIYAGTVKKNGYEWLNKNDVTSEALSSVAQYLLFNHKAFRFRHDGKQYELNIKETDHETN